jgi:SAM-dependent methyltransferase
MMVRIFKYLSSEDEQSPEFRYLLSVCVARARDVFEAVDLCVWRPGAAEPTVSACGAGAGTDTGPDVDRRADYVLLLGRDNVWLTVETLQRMKDAIDRGADGVTPTPVTDYAIDERDPLYTARDFDQVEQRVGAAAASAAADGAAGAARTSSPSSHLPVSLFSGAAFAAVAARTPVSRLLTDPSPAALPAMPLTRESARAGLFHRFSDYYGETRADLLPYLPPDAEDVLEIGCGRGFTGRLIQERLGCRVTGVEQHPEVAAEAARHLSRVIVGDILTLDLDGQYDAVVASELFEHLADPDAFLIKMKPRLKPGGRIVLSVPNVGHYSVVEDLLAGRWDYLPAGLLCYTHLRFFTRRTLADWMARLQFDCTIVPQTTDLPERFHQLPAAFGSDIESLRTRGFYVILRPASTPSAGSTS